MSLDTDYIAFYTRNFTGSDSTSGYALDICPFTFIPRLYLDRYSDERILWDFGDGTTSTSLCATHAYLFPGKYTVKLYVYKEEGQAVTSTYTSTVNVYNFITDTIALSTKSSFIQEAGSLGHDDGIDIFRTNSWQSFNAVSAQDYTITLFASGGNDNFFDLDEYNSNKFSHLDLSYKFYKKNINSFDSSVSYEPIDSIQTTSTSLFAKISGNDLVLCDEGALGSSFVGTKGSATVYFTSDSYNINDMWFRDRKPVYIFAGFDTSNFDDYVSYNNGYREIIKNNKFAYLNNITTNAGFTIIPQLSVTTLDFSLNGIDGIKDEATVFNIRPTQYAGTKIPIVIRAKNTDNYPAKYLPLLSANNNPTQDFQVRIVALSGSGDLASSTGQPVISSNPITTNNVGGYWKGYLIFDNDFVTETSLSNIYLSAYTTYSETFNFLKHPTPIGVFIDPNSSIIYRANILQSYQGSDSTVDLKLDGVYNFYSSVTSTSGLESIQVVPEDNEDIGSYYSFWIADKQNNRLIKYNSLGTALSTINCASIQRSAGDTLVTSTPTPYYIAADSQKNIWVTFYNSISAVKLNSASGKVDYLAAPNLTNTTYTLSSAYLGYVNLSSFIGKNTILPSAIDTDKNDNIWVSYANPLSAYIFKYSSTGAILSSVALTAGYSPTDLVIGTDNNVWVIAQQYFTTNTDISGFRDIVIYHNDLSGITTSVYETTGRAANITIDTQNNAYITVDNSSVVKLLSADYSATIINTQGSTETPVPSSMNLTGIASTASKEVIVIDNSANKLNVIDTVSDTNVNNYSIGNVNAQAKGDWTGFRWIAKYSPRTFTLSETLTGTSNTFSVVPAEDRFQIGKFGENFDATELYKDLRYQEALTRYDNIFNNFIGTIVGNISSSPNTIGKRVYERAENFVSNTVDPDVCGIDALYSLCEMYDIDVAQFDRFKFATPANLRRVIDLISIKQSKLWGSRNKFSRDFDIKGYNPGNNDFYGKNLGTELNIQYTILTAGSGSTPIVAQSKFSGDYIYINTDILSSQYIEYIGDTETYNMSAFNVNWGWPLVLPTNATYEDLKQNYRFYNYIPGTENTQYEGIINWGDVITDLDETLSARNTWIGQDQTMEEIIRFTLMAGLSVFDSSIDLDA